MAAPAVSVGCPGVFEDSERPSTKQFPMFLLTSLWDVPGPPLIHLSRASMTSLRREILHATFTMAAQRMFAEGTLYLPV